MWKFTGKQRPDFAIEPSANQESVWDYPRPPQCVPDSRLVEIKLGDVLVASSENAIRVLETASPPTVYIPRDDVEVELIERSVNGGSYCEWKGAATYWNFVCLGKTFEDVGWSYERPNQAFSQIAGYLSFYPARIECWIAGERVKPQGGGFYGGWVTQEIVGPYKGEPGTGGW